IVGFNVLVTFGQMLVESSRAAIIAYTMPALTAALAVVFLGEKLSWRIATGLGLGMLGLAILLSETAVNVFDQPIGPAVMLLGALSWAIGNICLKSRTWSLKPLPLSVWFFAVAAAITWPLALTFETPLTRLVSSGLPSPAVLATFAFHVAGPMVVCYALWNIIVSRLPATVAAISTLMAPVVGVLSSAVVLGEALTAAKLAALSLIVVSIALSLRPARNK
ncbi:MAG: DMT family transporter, partial [Pseudomonadota bacterium]